MIKQTFLLAQISGIANNAVSFSNVINLNNNKSNKTYLSDKVSTYLTDILLAACFLTLNT